MGNWPALVVAPSLMLTNLSLTYALVPPLCERQSSASLHWASAIILLLCVVFTWQAWSNWRLARAAGPAGSDGSAQRPPFMALVAFLTGALSSLTVLAQWFPTWLLSPCAS